MVNYAINSTMICDDVRVENNGKLFIIGLYIGEIILVVPGPMSFTFILEFEVESDAEVSVGIRIRIGEENKYESFSPKMRINSRLPAVIPFGPIFLEVYKDSILVCEAKIGDNDWVTVRKKRVTIKKEKELG